MKTPSSRKLAINGGSKVRTRPFPGRGLLGREEKAAVDAMFDASIASGEAFGYNGPPEEAYGREFARFMGGGYADGVNSGTTAVYVALRALDLEPFSEVIVSAITDPGGMMPVVMLNCIPMVADTMPGSYNIGAKQVAELLSPRTSAILVSHIGGEPADIQGIVKLARRRRIPVVEDCSQSHGARLDGRLVGTFGDLAAFSTMFGKHHCTGGQGGVVYTRSEKRYWAVRRAADRGKPFGLPPGSTNCIASLNYNLNDLAATIGRVQLKKLPGIVQRRRRFVTQLAKGVRQLRTLSLPPSLPGAEPSYWFLRVRFHADRATCDRATFCQALIAEGLSLNPSYRGAMPHTMEWYQRRRVFGRSGYPWTSPLYKGNPNRRFACPNALAVTDEQFNLTVYESWGPAEAEDILAAFRKVERAFLK